MGESQVVYLAAGSPERQCDVSAGTSPEPERTQQPGPNNFSRSALISVRVLTHLHELLLFCS